MRRTIAIVGAAIYIGILLGAASAADENGRGRELFERRCSGCHAIDQDKEGPRLRGVYGRKSGTVSSFHYSDGLRNASITWDSTTLDRWLTDPEKMVADTDMAFHVERADERAGIIAYLKEISGKSTGSPDSAARRQK